MMQGLVFISMRTAVYQPSRYANEAQRDIIIMIDQIEALFAVPDRDETDVQFISGRRERIEGSLSTVVDRIVAVANQ